MKSGVPTSNEVADRSERWSRPGLRPRSSCGSRWSVAFLLCGLVFIAASFAGGGARAVAAGPCESGQAVEAPLESPLLTEDCNTLLAIKDTLAPGAQLNWDAAIPIEQWEGLELGGTPLRVTGVRFVVKDLGGTIPPEISRLSGLEILHLSRTGLKGGLPPELGELSNLRTLWVHGNPLGGEIPPTLGNLTSLRSLNISGNNFDGSIPLEIGKLSNLKWLNLSFNNLGGHLTPILGELWSLETLDLTQNEFAGEIPEVLAGLPRLHSLYLASNAFSGPIPGWLGEMPQLLYLHLGENEFTGTLPEALRKLTQLRTLDVDRNRLSGPIPSWLGDLSHLESLVLRGNRFSGPIPEAVAGMPRLKWLILNENDLTGPIPPSIGNATQMRQLGLGGNRLTGPIPQELFGLKALEALDLGPNHLTGSIPAGLGDLSALRWLLLPESGLGGSIPPVLGSLSNLLTLDLRGNGLTGSIPPEFGKLRNLASFNVRGNQLTGCVPRLLVGVKHDGLPRCPKPSLRVEARVFGEAPVGTRFALVSSCAGESEAAFSLEPGQRREVSVGEGRSCSLHVGDEGGASYVRGTFQDRDITTAESVTVSFVFGAEEIELTPAWTRVGWPGSDGIPVAEALGGVDASASDDITDVVLAVYWWDEATHTWQSYFPAFEDVPGINTLATLRRGEEYWFAVREPVTWLVAPGDSD